MIKSLKKNVTKEFTFHKIIKEDVSQAIFTNTLSQEIYDNCRFNSKSGLNLDKGSLIFSYGVTNSGKTYTILGTE
jgi:hypothetical protein